MKFKSNARTNKHAKEGSVFYAYPNGMQVSVHKIIHLEGWFVSCYELDIEGRELKSDTLEGAIVESREVIRERFEKLKEAVDLYCNDMEIDITH